MRGLRYLTGAVVALVASTSQGCYSPQEVEAVRRESIRVACAESSFTPIPVTSIVLAGVPNSGPSVMHVVVMDAVWRSWVSEKLDYPWPGPSPFDTLDPNRPVIIRYYGDTTEVIIRGPNRVSKMRIGPADQ